MPKYAIDWTMTGTAVIEADDEDEAEALGADALRDFETYNFEEFEIDDAKAKVQEEVPDDD